MSSRLTHYILGFFMLLLIVPECGASSMKQDTLPATRELWQIAGYEEGIDSLSQSLSEDLAQAGKTSIAIVDFIGSENSVTEFGKTAANDLSVVLADSERGFWIVSGSYLRGMLDKQNLTMTELAENPLIARKFWQIIGIEAVVTGTVALREDRSVRISTRIFDVSPKSSRVNSAQVIGESSENIYVKKDGGQRLWGTTRGVGQIPEFPWPPPEASASTKIPPEFLVNSESSTSLQEVAERLEKAFDQAGYGKRSYYQVSDGFALISQLEHFYADGTSKESPDRWAVEISPPRKFSMVSYVKSLFAAQEGHYRIIAFIVTSQPFAQSSKTVAPDEVKAWLSHGADQLPATIGEGVYTDNHYCTALIYEFEQTAQNKDTIFKQLSELSGLEHLEKATVWSALFSLRAILQF